MRFLCLRPSAKLAVDIDQVDLRELFFIFLGNRFQAWAIVVLGCNLLAFFCVQILKVRSRYGTCLALVHNLIDHSDRWLSQDGD